MQPSGQTVPHAAQPTHASAFTAWAYAYPLAFTFFRASSNTSYGHATTHRSHPLHLSVLITTAPFILFITSFLICCLGQYFRCGVATACVALEFTLLTTATKAVRQCAVICFSRIKGILRVEGQDAVEHLPRMNRRTFGVQFNGLRIAFQRLLPISFSAVGIALLVIGLAIHCLLGEWRTGHETLFAIHTLFIYKILSYLPRVYSSSTSRWSLGQRRPEQA